MTKVVIYSNANLESFYEQTLQYLHEKYHSHPTMLDYGPLTDTEAARISCNDGLGRDAARRMKASGNIRTRADGSQYYTNEAGVDIPLGKMIF